MKKILLMASLAAVCGCQTEIKAPEPAYPVFGPYMTPEGNKLANPLCWSQPCDDISVSWCPESQQYVVVLGGRENFIQVTQNWLLSQMFRYMTRCAYRCNEKDGTYGTPKGVSLVMGDDAKWRIFASALTKKDDESSRRIFVLKADSGDAYLAIYTFERWLDIPEPANDFTVYKRGAKRYCAYKTDAGLVVRDYEIGQELGEKSVTMPLSGEFAKPFFVRNAAGRFFLCYTEGAFQAEEAKIRAFALGGDDPLAAGAWKPLVAPVLVKGNGLLGPGGAVVFFSPDERETWLAYSAWEWKTKPRKSFNVLCAEKLKFDAVGNPAQGIPAAIGEWRAAPSGEPPKTIVR